MVKVQTQYNWTQSYIEQCKMKKGTSVLADYGLQQDAATVEISPEGSRKAMAYERTNINELAEEQAEVYDAEEFTATIAERSVDTLVKSVLEGEEVSAEEKERLNEELMYRIRMQYAEMYALRLDESDEKVQEALKKNYFMKQQALKDMGQAAEKEKQEAETAQQEAENAQNADAVANKAAEADMIEESLESLKNLEQMTKAEVQRSSQQEENELINGKVSGAVENNTVSDKESASVNEKVLRYDAKNKGNIKQFDDQQLEESAKEKEYGQMLDDSYRMAMQVFENNDFSMKERVEAYQSFMKDSKELAENREIERYLKIYDYRSATDLRIKALSDRGVKTVAKTSETGQKNQPNHSVINHVMRSVGQEIVEEAAREKEKTKTVSDDLTKKKKSYIEPKDVEELKKTSH